MLSNLYEGRKDWTEAVTAHVQMLRFICLGDTVQACQHTEALVNPFTKVYLIIFIQSMI